MIRNFKFKPLCIIAFIFLLYGIGLFIFGGYNVGNLMAFGIGVFAAFLYFCKEKSINNKIIKFIKILGLAAVLTVVFLMIFTAFSFGVPVSNKEEDAVIVLGCGLNGSDVSDTLKNRLDSCLEYLEENPGALIVVSGGQGFGEDIAEAEAMEKYLISKGVSEEKILKEPDSSSTYENFVNSKKLLDGFFAGKDSSYTAAFITNRFHCYRAYNLAKNAQMDVSCYAAPDEIKTALPSYLRESLAVIKLWILGI